MKVHVRYETPDDNGETRRDRNERHDIPSPEFEIPEGGEYLWNWYFEISEGLRRIDDGVCFPMPPSEIIAWKNLTDRVVSADEYAILRAMDATFCEHTNKELQAYHERQAEENKQAIEAAQRGAR